MKFSLYLCFFFLLLSVSCQPGDRSSKATGDQIFRTTPPSHLYFKNLRATAYKIEREPITGVDNYRHRRLPDSLDRPLLYPLIVNNWMEDEAYLKLRRIPYPEGYSVPLQIHWMQESKSGTIEMKDTSLRGQRETAISISEKLRSGAQMEILDAEGERRGAFTRSAYRQLFVTIVDDYLRLTDQK
ncbi:MAG: hypothetical protein R3350_04390 [Saprospiraceae bacterium]|nr:hypothetical protein [Saprospiraceae bacterium]